MAWSFSPGIPVYLQIADRLRYSIISGEYPPGSQIPTVRGLSIEAAVNPNTIQHAFLVLENSGIIVTKGTMGRFVTEDPAIIKESRHEHARMIINSFLDTVTKIGYEKSEILSMIEEEWK